MPVDSRPNSGSTALYFVRHGQTEYNRKGIVQGRLINSTLNATGRAQAKRLGERLRDHAFDAIYTSTLRRAEQTMRIIAEHHPDVAVHRLKDLEEMSWGAYEGKKVDGDVQVALDRIKAEWKAGVFDRAVEDGESILEVRRRAQRAVRHILDRHKGQTVLVVTHGRFLRVLISSLLDDYGLERMHEVGHSNTCVNHLVCENGSFQADFLNCTAHLESAGSALTT